MDDQEKARILSACDHTLLKQTASWDDIRTLCQEAVKWRCASVCIPPCYVRDGADYLRELKEEQGVPEDQVKACTVIGFPNGYSTTESKVFEARDAIENGADEIDMVINVGRVKAGNIGQTAEEIRQVKEAAGDRTLKVIVETCFLTDEEKKLMCHAVMDGGADFIKTSTGFATGGATFDDIRLMADEIQGRIGIKAAGGISSFEDAAKFMELGATRLGTSRLVKLAEEEEKKNNN